MPLLQAESLGKFYRAGGAGAVRALDDVSLAIERGSFTLLTGPSGAGKTTLLALLGALERPTRGRVLFAGKDLGRCSDAELARTRRRMGFIFQDFALIPSLTCAENVTYPLIPWNPCAAEPLDRPRTAGFPPIFSSPLTFLPAPPLFVTPFPTFSRLFPASLRSPEGAGSATCRPAPAVFFTFAWDAASRSAVPWRRLFQPFPGSASARSTPVRRKLPRRAWAATTLSPPPPTATARSAALAALFQQPASTARAATPICRAYFLEQHNVEEAAERFHLRVEVDPLVECARLRPAPQPRPTFRPSPTHDRPSPKRDAIRDRACELYARGRPWKPFAANRRQKAIGSAKARPLSPVARRGRGPQGATLPSPTATGRARPRQSAAPAVADVQQRGPDHRSAVRSPPRSRACFLFVPQPLTLDLPDVRVRRACPVRKPFRPCTPFLALLLPKLLGCRPSVMISDLCADEGAGLLGRTQRPAQDDLRHRLIPTAPTGDTMHERLIAALIAKTPLGHKAAHLQPRLSRHPVSRARAGPGKALVPLLQSCSARGDGLRGPGRRAADQCVTPRPTCWRADADGMVPQFARYWKEQTGQYPARLLSRFAGHHLCGLEPLERGPRRLHHHSAAWVEHACTGETSAGRILAANAKSPRPRAQQRRQVRYVDEVGSTWTITRGVVRQLIVTGLGHESPTFFLTNDRPGTADGRGTSSRPTPVGITSRIGWANRSRSSIWIACAVIVRLNAGHSRSHADSGGGSVVSVLGRAFERLSSGQHANCVPQVC